MKTKQSLNYIIDAAGLMIIGIYSLLYFIFSDFFAEQRIQLSFLDFPIFVGEIALMICLALLITKFQVNKIKLKSWHVVFFIYLVFVIAKALYGYLQYGPLALRHAALFYYPLFAVCTYYFYRKEFFETSKLLIVFCLLLLLFQNIFIFQNIFMFNTLFNFTCVLLGLIVIAAIESRKLQMVLLLLLVSAAPYEGLFYNSRTVIISSVVSLVFLTVCFIFIAKRIKLHMKLFIIFLIISIYAFGLSQSKGISALKACFSLKRITKEFKEFDKIIQEKNKKMPKTQYYGVKIFFPSFENTYNRKELVMLERHIGELKNRTKLLIDAQAESDTLTNQDFDNLIQEDVPEIDETKTRKIKKKKVLVAKKYNEDQVDETQSRKLIKEIKIKQKSEDDRIGNIYFRLFIWRDLIREILKEKPIMGFHFGKPFRSRSIEVMNWASGEWHRDGWIGVHNSYLHLIYRAGIIGLFLIIFIIVLFFDMVKRFFQSQSLIGVLLSAVCLHWFVNAMGMLAFELPYLAIPTWSIFGLTLAYSREKTSCQR